MDTGRTEHLQMIQGVIDRISQCSFQLKGWAVTLAAALEIFLKGEAASAYLFVPALPVVAFWLLDARFLRQERMFRALYDNVRTKTGPADFSMETTAFLHAVPSFLATAGSVTSFGFYGPVLIVLAILALVLPR